MLLSAARAAALSNSGPPEVAPVSFAVAVAVGFAPMHSSSVLHGLPLPPVEVVVGAVPVSFVVAVVVGLPVAAVPVGTPLAVLVPLVPIAPPVPVGSGGAV